MGIEFVWTMPPYASDISSPNQPQLVASKPTNLLSPKVLSTSPRHSLIVPQVWDKRTSYKGLAHFPSSSQNDEWWGGVLRAALFLTERIVPNHHYYYCIMDSTTRWGRHTNHHDGIASLQVSLPLRALRLRILDKDRWKQNPSRIAHGWREVGNHAVRKDFRDLHRLLLFSCGVSDNWSNHSLLYTRLLWVPRDATTRPPPIVYTIQLVDDISSVIIYIGGRCTTHTLIRRWFLC